MLLLVGLLFMPLLSGLFVLSCRLDLSSCFRWLDVKYRTCYMESFVLAVSTKTVVHAVTSGPIFNIVADGIIVLAVGGLLFLLAVPAGYVVNAVTGLTDFFSC
jgi:hypothetical protein